MIRLAVAAMIAAGAAVALWLGTADAAAGQRRTPVPDYVEPVDAPVVDGFRPPANRYAAGNRGLEYGVRPGRVVRASAAGQVSFAGRIGAHHYVTITHADRVRTTYSYLASLVVHRGDRVALGQPIGTTGATFHFGARIGSAYVDPAILLAGGNPGPPRVMLVPHPAAGSSAWGDGPAWLHSRVGPATAGPIRQRIDRARPTVAPPGVQRPDPSTAGKEIQWPPSSP